MMDQAVVGFTTGIILGLTAWFIGWLARAKPIEKDPPVPVPYRDIDHELLLPGRNHGQAEHDSSTTLVSCTDRDTSHRGS
jgi:hypothetical protein